MDNPHIEKRNQIQRDFTPRLSNILLQREGESCVVPAHGKHFCKIWIKQYITKCV